MHKKLHHVETLDYKLLLICKLILTTSVTELGEIHPLNSQMTNQSINTWDQLYQILHTLLRVPLEEYLMRMTPYIGIID